MTRKRYIKNRMARGWSRNAAAAMWARKQIPPQNKLDTQAASMRSAGDAAMAAVYAIKAYTKAMSEK